jgi:hypothetical protein
VTGDAAGAVRALDAGGRVVWRFDAGSPVNALCAADVDGDGALEVAAGCEDCRVHLLDRDGRQRWERRFGILPATYGLYAGLGQIRRVHVDDLDADGQPEIYVSPDNMHLHALAPDGAERWRMVSQYGPFTAYCAIDLYGEGRRVLAGGMSRNTCHSAVQVVDASGRYVDLYVNDGWTSSLGGVWAGDLDGDGKLEILAGTNRGWLRLFDARPQPLGRPLPPFQGDVTMKSFEWAEPRDRIRWARHLGGPIQAVAAFAGLAVGGSEAGFVTAFDPAGRKRWYVQADGAVARLLADGDRCIALTRDGQALVIDPDGRPRAALQLGGSPAAAELADNTCMVACADGGLYAI